MRRDHPKTAGHRIRCPTPSLVCLIPLHLWQVRYPQSRSSAASLCPYWIEKGKSHYYRRPCNKINYTLHRRIGFAPAPCACCLASVRQAPIGVGRIRLIMHPSTQRSEYAEAEPGRRLHTSAGRVVARHEEFAAHTAGATDGRRGEAVEGGRYDSREVGEEIVPASDRYRVPLVGRIKDRGDVACTRGDAAVGIDVAISDRPPYRCRR